jgi:hypothetical protein
MKGVSALLHFKWELSVQDGIIRLRIDHYFEPFLNEGLLDHRIVLIK